MHNKILFTPKNWEEIADDKNHRTKKAFPTLFYIIYEGEIPNNLHRFMTLEILFQFDILNKVKKNSIYFHSNISLHILPHRFCFCFFECAFLEFFLLFLIIRIKNLVENINLLAVSYTDFHIDFNFVFFSYIFKIYWNVKSKKNLS